MGLFGGTTVAVASTVYNMAGDINKRPNYLKSVVISSVITDNNFSITDCLSSSYMNGPGIQSRNFCRWAVNHFQGIGIPEVNLGFQHTVSYTTIQGYIPLDPGNTATIIDVRNDRADVSYWAEEWLFANNPSKIGDTWTFAPNTDGSNTGTITYSDLTTSIFPLTGYDASQRYIYVVYLLKDSSGTSLGSRIWIYQVGSGHVDLDEMVRIQLNTDNTFFPVIPIRWKNEFLSSTYMPDAYALCKKAYKKATSQKFDDLVKKLATNDDIGTIQYIYVVYGCSLNTIENASKKYIFKFFEQLANRSTVTMVNYQSYLDDLASYTDGNAYPYMPSNEIQIHATGSLIDDNYNISLSWSGMSVTTTTGIGNGGTAKPGDCWFNVGTLTDGGIVSIGSTSYQQDSTGTIQLHQQMDNGTYKTITIANLIHTNLIYKDKSVVTKAVDALNATDESEFIVPLSYEIQREMSIIDSTQMMMSSVYLVMNTFKIHKKKWYETTFFMIIVVIAIVAIAVATGGIGAGTVGLLGTAGAVGAAVGLTGLLAVIVGTLINMLAAMILTKLIGMLSVAVLGPKLGAIIGAIVSALAIAAGGNLMSGQSLSSLWGNLSSAQSLISLGETAIGGVSQYINQMALSVEGKTQKLGDTYQKDSKEIEDKYLQEFGMGTISFDAFGLTDIGADLTNNGMVSAESPEGFLQRTLMTGSDIAELSMDMITRFTDITLDTSTMFGGS